MFMGTVRAESFACVSGVRFAAHWCQEVSVSDHCVSLVDAIQWRFGSSLRSLQSYVRSCMPWEEELSVDVLHRICFEVSEVLQSLDHCTLHSFSVIPAQGRCYMGIVEDTSDDTDDVSESSEYMLGTLIHNGIRMVVSNRDVLFFDERRGDTAGGTLLLSIDVGHWKLWTTLFLLAFGVFEE